MSMADVITSYSTSMSNYVIRYRTSPIVLLYFERKVPMDIQ